MFRKDKDKDKSRHTDHGPITPMSADSLPRANTGSQPFKLARSSSTFYIAPPSPKQGISFSTLDANAQQSSYRQGAQAGMTTEKQIADDIVEVRNVLANYAVEPLEILHLSKFLSNSLIMKQYMIYLSRSLASTTSRRVSSAT